MSLKSSSKSNRLADSPIAVVGLSALFPGAKDLQSYWNNILSGNDFLEEVPSNRWNLEDYYDPDPSKPDKIYCKKGGFVPELDFNPLDFGLPPNILEVTDSSQLLTLVLAKTALIDAGIGEEESRILSQTGIILGVCGGQKLMGSLTSRLQEPIWRSVLSSAGLDQETSEELVKRFKSAYVRWEENSFPGLLGNVIAGRVANRLNLGGTNCVVDAACGSSLAAMKMAISELREGRCDVMLTGGVDTDNSPFMYMCFSKTPAFTKRDQVQPFDKNSEGIMIGEGLGLVVLKRLEDAVRDGDRIYAKIIGVGSSSDGRFKSIYAPREEGQVLAIQRAQSDANIENNSGIGLIEAHGTGTKAGDITEFSGLRTAYASEQRNQIALGTVKAQIGHTKAAAGVAGFIKIALSLHHKILPPLNQLENPHPDLRLSETPFYFCKQSRPWIRGPEPRRAGVSAFGFGGSNFHFILEEHKTELTSYRLNRAPQPVLLSAENPVELQELCKTLLDQLSSTPQIGQKDLLEKGNQATPPAKDHARLGFVSDSPEESIQALQEALLTWEKEPEKLEWSQKSGIFYRQSGLDCEGKVAALFCGQGSQYLQMGRELFLEFPEIQFDLQEMDQLFVEDERDPLSKLIFAISSFEENEEDAQNLHLQKTENAQPAIGALSGGMFRLLKARGLQVDFTSGHSFGELSALWAAGVINDNDYHRLAVARGKAMAAPDDPDFDAGTMMAVMGKVDTVEGLLEDFPDLKVANFNSNKQVVVAGPKDQIEKAFAFFKSKRFSVVSLPVSAAFHTPLVGHAQKPFSEAIQSCKFNKARVPVFSNQTAKAYPTEPVKIKEMLQAHILESVRFKQQIENLYEAGARVFIEFGPKNVLTKLTENILQGKEIYAVALNPNPKEESSRQFREAYVQLQVLGLPLSKLDPHQREYQSFVTSPSKANVRLHGGNYVSEATRTEFAKFIGHDCEIQSLKRTSAHETNDSEEEAKPNLKISEKTSPPPTPQTLTNNPVNNKDQDTSNYHPIQDFYRHQQEVLRTHQQYLAQQMEYARAFWQVLQQFSHDSEGKLTDLPTGVQQNLQWFHHHQQETLKIHEQYLKGQSEQTQIALQWGLTAEGNVSQMPRMASLSSVSPETPVKSEVIPKFATPTEFIPAPALNLRPSLPVSNITISAPQTAPEVRVSHSETSSRSASQTTSVSSSVQFVLLEIVAEKTGYPTEMLELDMDLEADLGIDSIKRVEILGALQEKLPDLQVQADELAEQRTLGQILTILQPEETKPNPSLSNNESSSDSENSTSNIQDILLNIVAEKTGYPNDMLELNMDLEADLGIDSIKRVEILGALQENLPDLQVQADELADRRTLGEILETFSADPPKKNS
ncbi:MAG: beta-ketoacyl synthase N-terminal-like domain-containing protein [bacterium]